MSIDITMPALSPTMEEGKLAKWHVKEGDTVAAGDVIAEIETDKATMEVESIDEGRIGSILVPEGTDNVKVNSVIAVLMQEGEADPPAAATARAAPEARKPPDTEANSPPPQGFSPPAPPKESRGAAASRPPQSAAAGNGADGEARVFASPLARRLARESGLDLAALSGSGPHGRVVKRDVEAATTGRGAEGKASPTPASAGTPNAPAAAPAGMTSAQVRALYEEGSYEAVPNDGMRKTVAARLTESKQTVPHFYLTVDCRIDALMAARETINAAAPKDEQGKPQFKLSVNDFVVKAWAVALQRVPAANATWAGDAVLMHKASDVAVAVAVPGGLFTPVVRGAESLSLRQISERVKDLATRARAKKLKPEEYQGGATSISNLGMYGIREFAAVINPPHGTILAVGAGEERVYADKGQVRTGHFITVTLSCDHRAVDGALGAEVLGVFKGLVETPMLMLA